jgi:ATP-binding cassette subfamily C exporter for protease/lipase
MLHPWLGIMAIFFGAVQSVLAWWGNNATKPTQADASKSQLEVNGYLQSKFRNAEVLEAMGMVPYLFRRWSEKNARALGQGMNAQAVSGRVVAWSKFVRYTQQSLALGGGALLVIQGELSPGAMIAANVLMTRALAPIDLMVSTWSGFLSAKEAFIRLRALLEAHPMRHLKLKGIEPKGDLVLSDVVASAPGRSTPIIKRSAPSCLLVPSRWCWAHQVRVNQPWRVSSWAFGQRRRGR